MKLLSGRITIAIVGLMLAGCARRLPHGIAERYLENLRQFNYGGCYQLLSAQDRSGRTLAEFLTEIPLAPDVSPVWFRPLLHQTRFELGDEERSADGLTASVPVKITTPDRAAWERTLNAASGPAHLTAETAQRSLDTGDYPAWVYSDKIFLTKEHHHWRVVAGFAARDRIVDQHRQAMNDYLEQRYDRAIPEWRAMIAELRNQAATGSAGLAEHYSHELTRILQLQDTRAEAKRYAAQIKLTGIAMKMAEDRVPGIFGTVTNSGKRPVDAIALTVSWYAGRGKDLRVIHHEEHAVVQTPIDFTDFTRSVLPLMPGESRPIGFILSAPQEVQQQASPYVTIGAIALTDPALLKHATSPTTPATAAAATPSPTGSVAATLPTGAASSAGAMAGQNR